MKEVCDPKIITFFAIFGSLGVESNFLNKTNIGFLYPFYQYENLKSQTSLNIITIFKSSMTIYVKTTIQLNPITDLVRVFLKLHYAFHQIPNLLLLNLM